MLIMILQSSGTIVHKKYLVIITTPLCLYHTLQRYTEKVSFLY